MSLKEPLSDFPSGINQLNPTASRERDGVVFDLDSYARHYPEQSPISPQPIVPTDNQCAALSTPEKNHSAAMLEHLVAHGAPAPVFRTDPVHVGWYENKSVTGLPYPHMHVEEVRIVTEPRLVCVIGSGSGSFLTSFSSLTSYSSSGSFLSSGYLSSGSFVYLSSLFQMGAEVRCVGGYGLELI